MNQLIQAKQQELKQTLGLINRADYANLRTREVSEMKNHAREVQKDIELLQLIKQTELVMGVVS